MQRDFSFITQQVGMFSYSGLSKDQMVRLRDEFGVYGIDSGRICVAALNSRNIDYVAAAIAKVVQGAASPGRVAVIGGGPAGLIGRSAGQGGAAVDVFDGMPSVGRKFLLAGRGGLNLTHSEPTAKLLQRYGEAAGCCATRSPRSTALRFARGPPASGIETFVGTSGRVFPTDMKAAALPRAPGCIACKASGVRVHGRHRWTGWNDVRAAFRQPCRRAGACRRRHAAGAGRRQLVAAGLGRRLVPLLQQRGGHRAAASFELRLRRRAHGTRAQRLERAPARALRGQPLKTVAIRVTDLQGQTEQQQGEFVLTATASKAAWLRARLREQIAAWARPRAVHRPAAAAAHRSAGAGRNQPPARPPQLSTHLKSRLGIQGLKMALLHEVLNPLADPVQLAQALKALPWRWRGRGRWTRRSAPPVASVSAIGYGMLRASRCLPARARCWTGSAYRRLPADRLPRHRPVGRAGPCNGSRRGGPPPEG